MSALIARSLRCQAKNKHGLRIAGDCPILREDCVCQAKYKHDLRIAADTRADLPREESWRAGTDVSYHCTLLRTQVGATVLEFRLRWESHENAEGGGVQLLHVFLQEAERNSARLRNLFEYLRPQYYAV